MPSTPPVQVQTPNVNVAIGIDFGTTYSCVAVYHNGKIKIITSPEGYKKTPSEVAFTSSSERLLGTSAKNQGALNPKKTIFNVKRLLGRKLDDPELQSEINNYPFLVVTEKSMLKIEIDKKRLTPEEVSAMIIWKMKNSAERYLGHKVKDAVITVPAYFNQAQRQATMNSAKIAGLNVLHLINEPTAAALTYASEKGVSEKQRVLVFDFGGGTLDVSIITISPGLVLEVNATSGNTNLGGTDFDQKLVEHFSNEFKSKFNIDISKNPRAMKRLRAACEATKKTLSTNAIALIEVNSLSGGIDFESKIRRAVFERLCDSLFEKMLSHVEKVLQEAKMNKTQIDEIVLVGGSTRIPKVQKLLADFFNKEVLNNYINADEAVAYGAALQAAALSGAMSSITVHDVTPFDLGLNSQDGITANTHIPNLKTIPLKNNSKVKEAMKLYEGKTNCIAEFKPKPALQLRKKQNESETLLKLVINMNGILQAAIFEKPSTKQELIDINENQLSSTEVEKMVKKTKEFEKEDETRQERIEARNRLEVYLSDEIRTFVESNNGKLTEKDRKTLSEALSKEVDWLEKNDRAMKNTLETRLRTIRKKCDEIITKY